MTDFNFDVWILSHQSLGRCVQYNIPVGANVFCINASSLLFEAFSKTFTEQVKSTSQSDYNTKILQACHELFVLLMKTIEIARGVDIVFIAFDGVSPVAKFQNQRVSKYLNVKPNGKFAFDFNSLTPGCETMILVTEYLKKRFHACVEDPTCPEFRILPKTLVYSSFAVRETADHKIATYLKNLPLIKFKKIFIYSASQEIFKVVLLLIRGTDSTKNYFLHLPDSLYLLRPIVLRTCVRKQPPEHVKLTIFNMSLFSAIIKSYFNTPYASEDFMVLSTLIGTDVVPRCATFANPVQALTALYDGYAQFIREQPPHKRSLADNVSIHWQNLAEFLKFFISKYSISLLVNNGTMHGYQRCVDNNGNFDFALFTHSYYQVEFNNEPYDTNDIKFLCQDFLSSVAWTFYYYKFGLENINCEWQRRTMRIPLFENLYPFLILHLPKTPWLIEPVLLHGEYPEIVEQLLAVQPLSSILLLPPKLQTLVRINLAGNGTLPAHSPLSFLMPKNCTCDKHNQVLLPLTDMTIIRSTLQHNNGIFAEFYSIKYWQQEENPYFFQKFISYDNINKHIAKINYQKPPKNFNSYKPGTILNNLELILLSDGLPQPPSRSFLFHKKQKTHHVVTVG